jgi:hypothetical protein
MLYLTRRSFPDRLLDGDDLDALADVWFTWYDEARSKEPTGGVGHHRVEGRLWGFPRHDGDRLQQVLARSGAAGGVDGLSIARPDPDTLAAATPLAELREPCSLRPLLTWFSAPELDGLPLMLRLGLHDWRGPTDGPPAAGGSLVICGQLAQGRLRLKGMWPAGLVAGHERLYEKARWSEEEALMRFLDGAPAPPPSAVVLAVLGPRRSQRYHHWLFTRFFRVPGQKKLPAFLGRVGFFVGVFAASVAVLVVLRPSNPLALGGMVAAAGGAACSLWGLGFVVWRQAREVVSYYVNMRAALRRVYAGPVRFLPVDLAAVGAWPDPHAAKYAAEVAALGGRHYLDVTHDPPPSGTSYTRLFALPEDPTYVHLLLLYGTSNRFVLFPARATLLVTTYFDSGERLTSSNSGTGYRKKLDPRVTVRSYDDAEDPADLLARHRRELQRLLGEGRRVQPLMGPEELLHRIERDHEETREALARYGYWRWGDALRQAFGLVRSEYRGRG